MDQDKVPKLNIKKCWLKYENQINFGPLVALERCEAFLLFLKKMLESGDVNIYLYILFIFSFFFFPKLQLYVKKAKVVVLVFPFWSRNQP